MLIVSSYLTGVAFLMLWSKNIHRGLYKTKELSFETKRKYEPTYEEANALIYKILKGTSYLKALAQIPHLV